MSKVYADKIEPRDSTMDVTIGTSTNTITLAGNDLRANTVKDSGGNTLWVSDGSGNLSSLNSALAGNLVLLSTQAFTGVSSVEFTTAITGAFTSTYDVYIFKCLEYNPASDGKGCKMYGSIDAGSSWTAPKTSTMFKTYSYEDGSNASVVYDTGDDHGNSANGQYLALNVGNDADAIGSFEFTLFNPSSTTYYKNWQSKSIQMDYGNAAISNYPAGYFNTTSPITGIQFDWHSEPSADGIMKMYGLL